MSSELNQSAKTDLPWGFRGKIELCGKGWPQFPLVGNEPALYRIIFSDGSAYIGQAEGLDDRLYGYRRPTQGVIGEYLLHAALVNSKGAILETFTDGDLSSRTERQRLEQIAIAHAKVTLQELHNGPRTGVESIRAMIAFHEAEIDRLRLKLKRAEHEGYSDIYMHSDALDETK